MSIADLAVPVLALWHVALAEALFIVALVVAINGLDDLAVDLAWLWLRRRATAPDSGSPADAAGPSAAFAIIIPAWDESAVIGAMLRRLLATQRWPDYRVFVGIYPNDPKGLAVVSAIGDARVRLVVVPRPGPTTKADCLNSLWRAVLADETATGRAYTAIVLHDAEDVVHPHELSLFARALPGHSHVQLPVLPLPDAGSPLVSGHYIDEFAESHGKDLLVRQWLHAGLPSAGVGVAFDRQALAKVAARLGGAPFAADSLTEDYELGLMLHQDGGRGVLVWQWLDGEPIGTAEHFPADFAAAVRQKGRWLAGIALAGWDRLGWSRGWAARWMLLRDRKAPLMALVTLSAYALALLMMLDAAMRQLLWGGAGGFADGPVLRLLLWFNFAILCWRLAFRLWFTARLRGPVEGLLAVPRAAVGNLINAAAALRAIRLYLRSLQEGRQPRWDKTVHRFPGVA